MHPEITSFGPFHLKFYGLALTLSFLAGTYISLRRARKSGISEDFVVWLGLVVLVLAVVGSRALYVLTHLDDYGDGFLGFFRIWEGGLTMYGGLIAATVGGIAFIKSKGHRVWLVADIVAPAIALGEAITRFGCFMNGCCFGTPTRLPWAVRFPTDSFAEAVYPGASVHPSQLYTVAGAVAVFLVIVALDKRKRYEGQLFWTCILLLSAVRFFVDFTRCYVDGDDIGKLAGLSFNNNQLIALGVILASLIALRVLRRARG